MPEEESPELEATLGCLAWFEERTAKLYEIIASKVGDRPISHLLRVLQHQSLSHKDIVLFIMGVLGMPEVIAGRAVCGPLIGPVAEATERLIEELDRGEKELRPEELQAIFKELEFIESSAGEETYVKIMAPLIKAVVDATREEWKREAVGYLIEEIVREEKFHESLVAEILRRAVGGGESR